MTDGIDRLEERLRRVATEADPVPDSVVAAARAAFTTRDLDAELAELVADSAVDEEPVLTRSVLSDVRMLSFAAADVTVDVDVEPGPQTGTVLLHGMAVGAVGEIVVVTPGSRVPAAIDAHGRFESLAVMSGPVRLELTTADGRRLATSWVTL